MRDPDFSSGINQEGANIKVLKAAAKSPNQTGACFNMHPYVFVKERNDYLGMVDREGLDLKKLYMSHVHLSRSLDYQRSLLDRGISIWHDTFGNEVYWDAVNPGSGNVSDSEPIEALTELCREGYDKQILPSQDVYAKIHLVKYGGHGHGDILRDIVPRLRWKRSEQRGEMLVQNPKRLFAN